MCVPIAKSLLRSWLALSCARCLRGEANGVERGEVPPAPTEVQVWCRVREVRSRLRFSGAGFTCPLKSPGLQLHLLWDRRHVPWPAPLGPATRARETAP